MVKFAIAFLGFTNVGTSFYFHAHRQRLAHRIWENYDRPERSELSISSSKNDNTECGYEFSTKLKSDYNAKNGNVRRPEFVDYVKLIEICAKGDNGNGPDRAAQLLQRLESFKKVSGYERMQVTMRCYEIVMKVLADKENPSYLEIFLFRMEEKWKTSRKRNSYNGTDQEQIDRIRNCYNICLDSWSKWSNLSKNGRNSANQALKLLQRMKKLSTIDPTIGPDKPSYTSVLRAFSRSGNAREAKKLLHEMENIDEGKDSYIAFDIKPNSMSYSFVIHALANSNGGMKAAQEAENILRKMKTGSDNSFKNNNEPNEYTYKGVIDSWGKSRAGMKGAYRAEEILEHMIELYKANKGVKPLDINVNAVVKAWSLCRGGLEAAERAEFILRRMDPDGILHNNDENRIDIWPNIETINGVVSAWAHCGTKDAPYKAERILQKYLNDWNLNVSQERQISPTVETYNIIIASHTRTKSKQAARKAEALLYELVNVGAPDEDSGKATTKSFGLVISCWSKSSDPSAAERADQLLKVLEKNYEEGKSKAKPNIIIYSQVLDTWSKSKKAGAAKKARAIFDKLLNKSDNAIDLRPNTITFNSILNSLANSNDIDESHNDAAALISKMYELKDDPNWDVAPNSRSLISYMACLAKKSRNDPLNAVRIENLIHKMLNETLAGNSAMMPDSFAFATAINAWVWSDSKHASTGIMRIIHLMESLYFNNKILSPPHAICYNAAIRYFLKHHDFEQANALVSMMEEAFLKGVKEAAADRLTYAALLNSYAQSDNSTAARSALQLFRRQQEQVRKGNRRAEPHNVCYNIVMACMAKSKKSEMRAQGIDLLNEMEDEYRKGKKQAKPDTVSYSTAINILSKSSSKDAGTKAVEILLDMERRSRAGDSDVRPNLLTFNTVLNVLSKLQSKAAALKAEELLLKMTTLSKADKKYLDIKPDLLSFTCVIQAWSDVKIEGAAARAEAILRQLEKAKNSIAFIPDVIVYNKVLVSWARCSNGTRADALLREMKNSVSVEPDAFSYKTVLLAWSQQEGGAKKAASILQLMEKKYRSGDTSMKPDQLCRKAVATALEKDACTIK